MCVGTRSCASNLNDANSERCLDSARHDRLHLMAMETFDVAIAGGAPAGTAWGSRRIGLCDVLRAWRFASARSRTLEISSRKSLRRLFESVLLDNTATTRNCGPRPAIAARKPKYRRIHRHRRTKSHCRSGVRRRDPAGNQTQLV